MASISLRGGQCHKEKFQLCRSNVVDLYRAILRFSNFLTFARAYSLKSFKLFMNTYTSHFHGYFLPIFDCGAKLSFTSLTSINHTICNKYFLFNYQLKLIKYLYYKEDTDILFALCFNDPCIVRAAFFANIARIAASVTLFPSGALPKAPKALVTVFS